MLKILLIGSHLGYNLEYYVKMALENLGHSVTFFGYRDILGPLASMVRIIITRSACIRTLSGPVLLNMIDKGLREEALKAEPDLMLSIKGEAVPPQTIEWFREGLGVKTALWYPDDPRYFSSLVKHIAPHYDYVFTVSERMMKMYREAGVKNVDYLPFACDPSVHKRIQLSEEKKRRLGSSICFVGTYYPRRGKVVGRLDGFDVSVYGPYWSFFKRGEKVNEGIWGPDMVKVFNASKIVLNIHIESDLAYKPNMKTFETTGSGAFLLTDKPYGLEKAFKIGEEVVCYNDEEELIELIKYYLNADRERMEVSVRGQERAYKEHTYTQRIKKILSSVGLS